MKYKISCWEEKPKPEPEEVTEVRLREEYDSVILETVDSDGHGQQVLLRLVKRGQVGNSYLNHTYLESAGFKKGQTR